MDLIIPVAHLLLIACIDGYANVANAAAHLHGDIIILSGHFNVDSIKSQRLERRDWLRDEPPGS